MHSANDEVVAVCDACVAVSSPIYPRATYLKRLSRWWVAFTASAVFVVCGHLLIKAGLNANVQHAGASGLFGLISLAMRPEVLTGLLIYLLGSICWIVAVAQQEISFLYPLSSLNYVLVVVGSSLLFHETVSVRRASGLVVIVVGMVLINRTRSRPSEP
jgi:drug/metabolite transporter (DMT)-like permease